MKKKMVFMYGIITVLLALSFIACDEQDNDTITFNISASYYGTAVAPNTPINNLKANLIVTVHYSNGTSHTVNTSDYTLHGNLTTEGTSIITVQYQGKTTTFSVIVSNTGVSGTGGTLTINGLPGGGTYAVYIFTAGTDISTYQAITNAYSSGSYQAVGAIANTGNNFTLVGWNGTSATTAWTGSGNLPVLLLNAYGSITEAGNSMYSYATVSFSNGNSTVNFSSFTSVVMGGGLTINGLSGGGTYAVYVFTAGTNVSTYEAISNAYISGSYQAVGATATAGNSFTLIGWNGTSATTAWTGSGNLPVLLLNATGSVTEAGNSMYSYATVNFNSGNGTANISNFTPVVMGGPIDPNAPTPGLLYTLNTDGTAYEVSIGTANASVIVIPSEYDGKPVTVIAIAGFRYKTTITSVTIPNSVTTISTDAFQGCTSLTSITIPDSVTTIRGYAFWDCTSLTSITIPDNVTSIGESAFYGCTSLISINVDENNPNYSSTIGLLLNKLKTTILMAPNGITSITIPDSVTSIGDYAFYGCTSLTSITIPNSVSIGSRAFYGCTSLTSITIPNSVTSISYEAFFNTGIRNNTADNSIVYVGNWVVGYKGTINGNITLNSGTIGIADNAFSYCGDLTSITIPNSVTSIGFYAFSGWTASQIITVPFANQNAADTAWGTRWRDNCNAVIVYQP